MRLLQYLQEEYITDIKGSHSRSYSGYSEIFCNPERHELHSLSIGGKDTVRFIINFEDKKLYVWGADVVHYEVSKKLKQEGKEKLYIDSDTFWKTCFAGVGTLLYGGKIMYDDSSDYMRHYIDIDSFWLQSNYDDTWLNRWFNKPFLKTMRIKEHLNEKYVTTLKGKTFAVPSFPVAIFVNPDKKELGEMARDIRFVIDFDNKDVYMWSGYALLHDVVIKALAKLENIKLSNIALGHSIYHGDKMHIFDFQWRCKSNIKKEVIKNLSWLDWWFDNIRDPMNVKALGLGE